MNYLTIYIFVCLFSPLSKLADRAIYFTFCNLFFIFLNLSQIISGSNGPIFMIFYHMKSICAGISKWIRILQF